MLLEVIKNPITDRQLISKLENVSVIMCILYTVDHIYMHCGRRIVRESDLHSYEVTTCKAVAKKVQKNFSAFFATPFIVAS